MFQLFSLFIVSFLYFLFVHNCGYLGLWFCVTNFEAKFGICWAALAMIILVCLLCIFVFVIGGLLAFVYICGWWCCLCTYVWLFSWLGEVVFWICVLIWISLYLVWCSCVFNCVLRFFAFCFCLWLLGSQWGHFEM